MTARALLVAAALVAAAPVLAQDEMPAIGGATPAAPVQSGIKGPGVGTTILGERESPIGLYITPWRNANAQEDLDRPARLLQEQMLPIDEKVFVRQLEYYEALSKELKSKGAVTPLEK